MKTAFYICLLFLAASSYDHYLDCPIPPHVYILSLMRPMSIDFYATSLFSFCPSFQEPIESVIQKFCLDNYLTEPSNILVSQLLQNSSQLFSPSYFSKSNNNSLFISRSINHFQPILTESQNPQLLGKKIATVVSGFWNISLSKHANNYEIWLQNSLQINMPYIFYTELRLIQKLGKFRNDLPTIFVPWGFDQFASFDSYSPTWTHSLHVPSPALGMIWLEKINLLLDASRIDRTSEYFIWMDAGLNRYRGSPPPTEPFRSEIIKSLPKTRVSYSYIRDYYGTHSFAGGVLIMHRTLIPLIHYLFYREYYLMMVDLPPEEGKEAEMEIRNSRETMEEVEGSKTHRPMECTTEDINSDCPPSPTIDLSTESTSSNETKSTRKKNQWDWRCGSDQIIFTRLREKYPHLFHVVSYDYGDIHFLWGYDYEE